MAFLLEFSPSIASHNRKRTFKSNENDSKGSEALFSQFSNGLQKLGVVTSVLRSPSNPQSLETVFSVKLPLAQKLLFRVSGDLRNKVVSTVASLCDGYDYMGPRSSELLKNCSKTVKKINSISIKATTHFALHPYSGQILLKSHIHLPTLSDRDSLMGTIRMITQEFVRSACVFAPLLMYTCNLLPRSSVVNGLSESLKSVILGPEGDLMQMADICELLPLASCELRSQQDKKSSKHTDGGVNCRKIVELYYKQREFSREACLYQQPNLLQIQVPINHEFTLEAFRKYLMNANSREQNKQTPNKQIEHTHIFNTISVNSGSRGREKLIGQGNRARILGLQLQYTFASSMNADRMKNSLGKSQEGQESTEEADQNEKRHTFERILAIKVPRATQNETLKRKMFQQIRYEKVILENFRGASSHYLARYYHSVQKTFEYRNCLLMDYISGNNLSQQLQMKSATISLSSKLNILVHLSNAIRFLQRYHVAHLDLSLGNIMVVKDYAKIIDFGEAFHPITTPKFTGNQANRYDYSPGRTFPYCPPETSQRITNFTSKQDLYSIGIICWKMLFGCVPYSCSQQTLEQSLKNKSYQSRIFIAPQRGENYGQRELISALFALIFKMIRPEEQLRPLPAWAHILFRKLYMALR